MRTKWRTQVARENADEPMILRVPVPVEPELVYSDVFHCPACNTAYKLTELLNPKDPWHICAFCGQNHDLRSLLRKTMTRA